MIHPTAIVHESARIASHVTVGPYAVLGAEVELGARVEIGAHSVVEGPTRIGTGNRIGPHAVLGLPPQDTGYRGEPTRLEIGSGNTIREFVTIHRATTKEEGVTRIGAGNYLMAYCHIAHDCRIGNNAVLANSVQLGGHAEVGDFANIGGLSGVHQFCRIGAYAMLGACSIATLDVPPYGLAVGNRARLLGINHRALQRHGFSHDILHRIREAYRVVFNSGLPLSEALARLESETAPAGEHVERLLAFMRSTRRGVTR